MAQGEEMTSELKVLNYLQKEGPSNTFRIASNLDMERGHILDIIKKLEEKGALTVKSGIVYFIEYPLVEKEAPELKIRNAKPKIHGILESENKQLKEKLMKLGEALNEFKKKANAPPKIITKTIIKKVPVIKLRKQSSKKFPSLKHLFKKMFVLKKQKNGRKIKVHQKKTKTSIKNKKFKFPKFKLMKRIKKFKIRRK